MFNPVLYTTYISFILMQFLFNSYGLTVTHSTMEDRKRALRRGQPLPRGKLDIRQVFYSFHCTRWHFAKFKDRQRSLRAIAFPNSFLRFPVSNDINHYVYPIVQSNDVSMHSFLLLHLSQNSTSLLWTPAVCIKFREVQLFFNQYQNSILQTKSIVSTLDFRAKTRKTWFALYTFLRYKSIGLTYVNQTATIWIGLGQSFYHVC